MIADAPVNAHLLYNDLKAEFICTATTDPSTPLTIRWYRVMDDGSEDTQVHPMSHVNISADGTRLTFQVTEDTLSKWSRFRGKYRCHATNGYSEANAECTLTVDEPPPPPTPPPMEETEEPEMTTTAFGCMS